MAVQRRPRGVGAEHDHGNARGACVAPQPPQDVRVAPLPLRPARAELPAPSRTPAPTWQLFSSPEQNQTRFQFPIGSTSPAQWAVAGPAMPSQEVDYVTAKRYYRLYLETFGALETQAVARQARPGRPSVSTAAIIRPPSIATFLKKWVRWFAFDNATQVATPVGEESVSPALTALQRRPPLVDLENQMRVLQAATTRSRGSSDGARQPGATRARAP